MEDEKILTSSVPRTLETKNKILGLELSDVVVLLLNLSIQNLIFGSTALKYPMVFGSSAALVLTLFLFKGGKPDHYLQHSVEHTMSPTVLTANACDKKYRCFGKGTFDECL